MRLVDMTQMDVIDIECPSLAGGIRSPKSIEARWTGSSLLCACDSCRRHERGASRARRGTSRDQASIAENQH